MLTRDVSIHRRMAELSPPPFGWIRLRIESRHAYREGPWWMMLGMLWRHRWEHRFYEAAIRLGTFAVGDGDYYGNGRWWPSCPRFSDEERFTWRELPADFGRGAFTINAIIP